MSAWFRTGSVNVTAGSKTITINNGTFLGNVEPGFAFVGPNGAVYEIGSVDSATEATLVEDYAGPTDSGQDYGIIPTKAPVAAYKASLDAVLSSFEGYADGVLAGKFPDGTAAAPSIAGVNDPDTGFSFTGGNQIRASVGGAQRTLLSSVSYLIDVPIIGTAVQSAALDTTAGKLLKVGAGNFLKTPNTASDLPGGPSVNDANSAPPVIHFYPVTSETANGPGSTGTVLRFQRGSSNFSDLFVRGDGTGNVRVEVRTGSLGGSVEDWLELWGEYNTIVDGSGFIKQASPVLRLYGDRIEEPVKQVGATMQRVGTGHYALSGPPPLASDGWQVQAPDGYTLGAPAWVDDALHVRAYKAGRPADLPTDTFALLRFWEPEVEGEAPPEIEAITAQEEAAAALADEREGMAVYALAWGDGCELVSYGGGSLQDAIDGLLAGPFVSEARRYNRITIFERNRPEVSAFLQTPGAIDLTDDQVDDFFRLCMHLEEYGPGSQGTWDGGTGSLTLLTP